MCRQAEVAEEQRLAQQAPQPTTESPAAAPAHAHSGPQPRTRRGSIADELSLESPRLEEAYQPASAVFPRTASSGRLHAGSAVAGKATTPSGSAVVAVTNGEYSESKEY